MYFRRLGVLSVVLILTLFIATSAQAQLLPAGGLVDLVLESGGTASSGLDDASNPPAEVGKLTAASGDLSVSLEWVNPTDSDFDGVLALRQLGSEVLDSPVDGITYTVGDTIGTSEVVCLTDSSAATCVDSSVSNGAVYHYAAFSFDLSLNYAAGVASIGHPRDAAKIHWGFATGGSALAPAGAIPQQHVIGIGNDQLLHRMRASDGTRGSWEPPQIGGSVQSRPMVGDLDPGAGTDLTAFVTAQDGSVYRYSLDDGTTSFEGSADAVSDASCASGILQAGPVVMLDAFDSNGNPDDDVIVVATRCGATDNKVLLYSHDLTTLHDSYDGGVGGLGISNATPIIVYRDTAENLVYVPVRDDGDESLVVLQITSGPAFTEFPFSTVSGIGDLDARPALVRRSADRFLFVGNADGEVFFYSAVNRTGGAGSPLSQRDSMTDAATDGPVKGLAVGSGEKAGSLWENWAVWSTDTTIHGIKIGPDGRFNDSSYWSVPVAAPSLPLVLRWVGGTDNTRVYVGSSDGYLYEFDAHTGTQVRRFLIETGKTVGDPAFDWADGVEQGIVVGTTSGAFHWVSLDWEGGE